MNIPSKPLVYSGIAILAVLAVFMLFDWLARPRIGPHTHPIAELIGYDVVNSERPDALKILFIGRTNENSDDPLLLMFAGFATSTDPDRPLKISASWSSDLTLERQWELGVGQRIKEPRGWDFVVLGEQDRRQFHEPAVMAKYVRLFDAEIKKIGAKTVLYQLPARRDQSDTQEALESYMSMAVELDALVVPAGMAWANALNRHTELELYQTDGNRPAPQGSYLTACVFYAALFKKTPEGLPCKLVRPDHGGKERPLVDLRKEVAENLQKVAWQTVKESEKSGK